MSNQPNKTIPKIKIKNNTIILASTDEDGFHSPRTLCENRNNNTPTQTQTFFTPNRFAALQNTNIFNFNTDIIEETEMVTQNHIVSTNLDSSKVPPKKDQIPPIFIANQKLDYNQLCKSLINLVGENGFHGKSTQKHTKVQANTSDVYRQIINFLGAQKMHNFISTNHQSEKSFNSSTT